MDIYIYTIVSQISLSLYSMRPYAPKSESDPSYDYQEAYSNTYYRFDSRYLYSLPRKRSIVGKPLAVTEQI